MNKTITQTIDEHRFRVEVCRSAAKDAHHDGWEEGRRQHIERALWHRSEAHRLEKLVVSRAAGTKTA